MIFNRKLINLVLLVCIIFVFLTGCISEEVRSTGDAAREGQLRVVVAVPFSARENERFDQFDSIRAKYFADFQRLFPKVNVELIPYAGPAEQLSEFINKLEVPADLILMRKLGFQSLVNENQLVDLNTYIKKDGCVSFSC